MMPLGRPVPEVSPFRTWRAAALLNAASVAACSAHSTPNAVPPATSAVVPQTSETHAEPAEPGATSVQSCKDLGLLPCQLPPSPLTELCPRAAQCLMSIEDPYGQAAVADLTCSALRNSAPAPARSGLRTTGILDVNGLLYLEGTWRTDASYLVAETSAGFCFVEQLLDWLPEQDSIETEFNLQWSDRADGAPELAVAAQRILSTSLDEQEFEDGTSPIVSEECNKYRFGITAARFQVLDQAKKEGRCFASAK
jgi:hypothetical protein